MLVPDVIVRLLLPMLVLCAYPYLLITDDDRHAHLQSRSSNHTTSDVFPTKSRSTKMLLAQGILQKQTSQFQNPLYRNERE